MSQHWRTQWKQKKEAIEAFGGVPWNFRTTALTANVEPNDGTTKGMELCCDAARVPEALREDTLVGSPRNKFWMRGQWVTLASLRHAYFAHTITSFLKRERGKLTILEIGAGYGGLAATLTRSLNIDTYIFVDAEPCLELQRFFTREALHSMTAPFFLTPNVVWEAPVDLIINTHSFAEMDRSEVERYFAKIHNILPDGGALYSVNLLSWQVSSFRDYPFDEKWRHDVLRMSRCESKYVESLSVRDSDATSPHPSKLLHL